MKIKDDLNDFYLTTKEVADVFGVTVQAIGKMCKDKGLEIQYGTKLKIYPEVMKGIYKYRGGKEFLQRKISFHSIKGGPGKTTLAHLISSRISSYGLKTLVIDLDKQANLTNSFGIDDESDQFDLLTMYDLYLSQRKRSAKKILSEELIVEITDCLHIIPANIDLANLDLALSKDAINYSNLISTMLKGIDKNYDVIVIDLPPDNNRVTISSHCYADTVFIPINMAQFSLKGLTITMDHLDVVRDEFGNDVKRLIVPNKMDLRTKSSYEILSAINKSYRDLMSAAIIPICRPLEDSYFKGKCAWRIPRAKPALQAVDRIVCSEFGMDHWNLLSPRTSHKKIRKGEKNA